jgi:hypothetical protein
VATTWGRSAAAALAVVGIGAAVYVYLGEPCKSSARIDWLYAAAVFLGAASFVYVTAGFRRFAWGIAAGVAAMIASYALFFYLALLIEYGLHGCYT